MNGQTSQLVNVSPADPERRDPQVGAANPHRSLWGIDFPYLGPPEEGQPRIGRWQVVEAEPEAKREPEEKVARATN